MRWNHIGRMAIAGIAIGLLTGLSAAPVAAAPPSGVTVRWVDGDGHAGGPDGCGSGRVAFTSVQDAVDASNQNDVIKVCPGVYHELVSINNRPGLAITAVKHWKATIVPPALTTPTTGYFPAAIYTTSDRTLVRWMRISIPASGDCDYQLNGIIADGAQHVQLRSNRLAGGAGDAGHCGLADPIIFTNGATGFAGYNLLTRFFEAGILASNESRVTLYRNSIRFFTPQVQCQAVGHCDLGASPAGAVNVVGVQIVDGATALVRRNIFRVKASTGIAFGSNSGVEVNRAHAAVALNRFRSIDRPIAFIQGATGSIRSNRVVAGGRLDGIVISASSGIDVSGNTVTGIAGRGIVLDTDTSGNSIHDNDFSGNGDLDCADYSVGPANTWTNDFGDESSPAGICTPKV